MPYLGGQSVATTVFEHRDLPARYRKEPRDGERVPVDPPELTQWQRPSW